MDQLLLAAQPDSSFSAALVTILAIAACAAVWTGIFVRKFQGLPVLPYEPRRQVPWNGLDVLVVFLTYMIVMGLVTPASKPAAKAALSERGHSLEPLLALGNPLWMILLAVLMAVIVAPLVEEFLFRVVLQGWLESVETFWRRRARHLRVLMRGSAAVVLSSLLFASVHFRPGREPAPVEETATNTALFAAGSLLSMILIVCFLRMRGATWADLGIVPRKWLADVKLGLLAFLAVTPPVMLLFGFCKSVFPKNLTPDPVPLFFLALALGVLCYRNRRIAPAIVLHAAINSVSVLIALMNALK